MVDALEITAPVERDDRFIQGRHIRCSRRARLQGVGDRAPDQSLIARGSGCDAHLTRRQQGVPPNRRPGVGVAGVIRRREPQRRKLFLRGARGLLPGSGGPWHHLEIKARRLAELRLQQHILRRERLQLRVAAAADQDREHLVGDARNRLQRIPFAQRKPDIHDDQHIDAHRARRIDRQIVGESTIDQQTTVDLDRREHRRRREARPQSGDQITVAKLDRFAGLEIGRHRAEAGGQLVEIAERRHRVGQTAQQLREPLPREQRFRQTELTGFEPQREVHEELQVFALATETQPVARSGFAERFTPFGREHQRLDLRCGQAARVQPPDHRAHAGAGDGIDRDPLGLEHLEHTDMGRAPRATPGEH